MVQNNKIARKTVDHGDGDSDAQASKVRRKPGRPRAFDPEVALKSAIGKFRQNGFSATSVDDLSGAMGINRPSLYATFGSKRDLFLKAYETYSGEFAAIFAPAFAPQWTIRETLDKAFAAALDWYFSGEGGPAGCLTTFTATSDAMTDPEIRTIIQRALAQGDRVFAKRFRRAVTEGELPAGADCDTLAQIASAVMQSLAIRTRAQASRAELDAMARQAVDLLAPKIGE